MKAPAFVHIPARVHHVPVAATGALYAWELERGRRTWRVPVRGGVVANGEAELNVKLAEQGLGLTYAFEPMIVKQLESGRLKIVLERYAPHGAETAKERAVRRIE